MCREWKANVKPVVAWGKPVKAIGNLVQNPTQEKCYTQARGFSPIHARVSPVGVRVCALACVRSRVHAWVRVGVRVRVRAIQRVRVRACATRVLSVGKHWKATGKPSGSLAGWLALYACLFCSLVNSLACHLSACAIQWLSACQYMASLMRYAIRLLSTC